MLSPPGQSMVAKGVMSDELLKKEVQLFASVKLQVRSSFNGALPVKLLLNLKTAVEEIGYNATPLKTGDSYGIALKAHSP